MRDKLEEMKSIAEDIRTDSIQILDKEIELNKKKQIVAEIELAWMNEIANETDAAGKALYSNDAKRQGKLLEYKEDDDDYQVSVDEIKAAIYEIDLMKINLQYNKYIFDAYKYSNVE